MLRTKRLVMLSAVLGVCCAAAARATPAVTVSLSSSLNELVVQPGDPIDWLIEFSVSTGNNAGLALLSVDFIQNKLNPGKLAILSAHEVPAGMDDFARPDGISSPGSGGYRGTQLGTDCYADLYCIGGAQNTFGVAGTSMGTDIYVDGGVGQSGTETLAEGEFDAPETRGVYIFHIENVEANVLVSVESPDPSPVHDGLMLYSLDPSSFYIIVCPGDVDGDGDVELDDLTAVLAAYDTCLEDPGYDPDADLNRDDCVDLLDLGIVTANYGSVCTE